MERSVEERMVNAFLSNMDMHYALRECHSKDPEIPNHTLIPQFLGRVWFHFIENELWACLKQFNNPTIDFKHLKTLVEDKVKNNYPDIFKK